jgi:uncharacterized protein YbcC (UPF0753/DUF2309 family)
MIEHAPNSLAQASSGEDAANVDSCESRRCRLRLAVQHATHVLPAQGPIGVFAHHNTLHAFQHRPFEQAVLDAARMFGSEPYMAEAYRAVIACGRIRIEDIDAVIESEPDAEVLPGLNRHSLRRAMITPGVREFDAATILWRAEQGDLAKDFRQPALKALFEACRARTIAHEDEPAPARPVDEVIHPWLIRLCSMFLDQGMAYWPMPLRERGFYEGVRTLLSQPGGIFPRYLVGLDKEFRRQEGCGFSSTDAVLDCLDCKTLRDDDWDDILQAELLALPGGQV